MCSLKSLAAYALLSSLVSGRPTSEPETAAIHPIALPRRVASKLSSFQTSHLQKEKLSQRDSSTCDSSAVSVSLGATDKTTIINAGVTYSISGTSCNILGNIDNSGEIYISQTDTLSSGPPTSGLSSTWEGHDEGNGNLLNCQGGMIQLNDISSTSATSYQWHLHSMTNNGTLQMCGSSESDILTSSEIQIDTDAVNNGMISFEQSKSVSGDSCTWKNTNLSSIGEGSNLYNHGAIRLINIEYHSIQNIYGTGCWQIGEGSTLWLKNDTTIYQNPSSGPAFLGQSINFQDSTAVLRIDQGVYSSHSIFAPQIYGFCSGNAIVFSESIDFLNYDASNGLLNVVMRESQNVTVNLGQGYDTTRFYVDSLAQTHSGAARNAIFYDSPAPSQSPPPACMISIPTCQSASQPTSQPTSQSSPTSVLAPTGHLNSQSSEPGSTSTNAVGNTSSRIINVSSHASYVSSTGTPSTKGIKPVSSYSSFSSYTSDIVKTSTTNSPTGDSTSSSDISGHQSWIAQSTSSFVAYSSGFYHRNSSVVSVTSTLLRSSLWSGSVLIGTTRPTSASTPSEVQTTSSTSATVVSLSHDSTLPNSNGVPKTTTSHSQTAPSSLSSTTTASGISSDSTSFARSFASNATSSSVPTTSFYKYISKTSSSTTPGTLSNSETFAQSTSNITSPSVAKASSTISTSWSLSSFPATPGTSSATTSFVQSVASSTMNSSTPWTSSTASAYRSLSSYVTTSGTSSDSTSFVLSIASNVTSSLTPTTSLATDTSKSSASVTTTPPVITSYTPSITSTVPISRTSASTTGVQSTTSYTPYYPALVTGYTTNPALTATTTAGQACPTQPEAGTYCGFINPEDPCAPQPDGYGPVPTPDTASAFLAFPPLHSMATAAPTVISSSNHTQYVASFSDLNAASNGRAYLGVSSLKSYDATSCAALCDETDLCTAFNIYAERDPSLNPSANDTTAATVWGYWCPDPPSMTSFKCALWGSYLSASCATNTGAKREEFESVIIASNGYNKMNGTASG